MYARAMDKLNAVTVATVLGVTTMAWMLLDKHTWLKALTTLWGLLWTPISIPLGLPIAVAAWALSRLWEPAYWYSRSYFCKGAHRAW